MGYSDADGSGSTMSEDDRDWANVFEGSSLWTWIGSIIAIWSAFNMDRTHEIAHQVADNVAMLPHDLAGWIAWAIFGYGLIAVLLLLVAVIALGIVIVISLEDMIVG